MIAEVAPAGQQGARIDQRQAVGGTVTEPFKRQSRTLAHSGMFTPDGKVIVFGHEPGGGTQPRCTATGTVLPGGVVQPTT